MKSKRKISISFLSFVMLSGCAQSSGVLQLGPNTYSIVTANELGGVDRGGGAGGLLVPQTV